MRKFFVCLVLISISACGGGSSGAADGPPAGPDAPPAADARPPDAPVIDQCPTTGRYLELVTGYTWTYQVTDPATGAVTGSKTQVVGALEDISTTHPGVSAFKLTTTKAGGTTDSWQEDTGTSIRRHMENDNSGANLTAEQYDPYRTREDEAPEHLVANATWMESYTELVSLNGAPATTADKVETWTVVAVDEVIAVPAGAFCALHLHRVSTVGGVPGSDKEYWFARGVGKIKETGGGQDEALTAYTR